MAVTAQPWGGVTAVASRVSSQHTSAGGRCVNSATVSTLYQTRAARRWRTLVALRPWVGDGRNLSVISANSRPTAARSAAPVPQNEHGHCCPKTRQLDLECDLSTGDYRVCCHLLTYRGPRRKAFGVYAALTSPEGRLPSGAKWRHRRRHIKEPGRVCGESCVRRAASCRSSCWIQNLVHALEGGATPTLKCSAVQKEAASP